MKNQLTCRDFIDFLDDYIAGVQAAEVCAEFERHMGLCPDCADYLKSYQETVRLVGEALSAEQIQAQCESAPDELIRAILAAKDKLPRD